MDIFKSKILLNLPLTIPISIICFIFLSFRLSFDVKSTVLVIIAIVLLAWKSKVWICLEVFNWSKKSLLITFIDNDFFFTIEWNKEN